MGSGNVPGVFQAIIESLFKPQYNVWDVCKVCHLLDCNCRQCKREIAQHKRRAPQLVRLADEFPRMSLAFRFRALMEDWGVERLDLALQKHRERRLRRKP